MPLCMILEETAAFSTRFRASNVSIDELRVFLCVAANLAVFLRHLAIRVEATLQISIARRLSVLLALAETCKEIFSAILFCEKSDLLLR